MREKKIHAAWWVMNQTEAVTKIRTVCGSISGLVDMGRKPKITCKKCIRKIKVCNLKPTDIGVLPGQMSVQDYAEGAANEN